MMSQIMGIDSLLHDLARFYIFQKKYPSFHLFLFPLIYMSCLRREVNTYLVYFARICGIFLCIASLSICCKTTSAKPSNLNSKT